MRVADFQGKMHGRKSVKGLAMARGELTRGGGGGVLTMFEW